MSLEEEAGTEWCKAWKGWKCFVYFTLKAVRRFAEGFKQEVNDHFDILTRLLQLEGGELLPAGPRTMPGPKRMRSGKEGEGCEDAEGRDQRGARGSS